MIIIVLTNLYRMEHNMIYEMKERNGKRKERQQNVIK